ncbi:T9SS C-terminal target domain-containing protein [Aquimarina sp. AD10]|uniref:glycosyl hydrolase family 18 protein n=1 Tax=Aquimarina sp. AD10 TaxID=1714849 RepID=UPI000E54FA45|nr:glycosyl hydrolase family 18 protein [Aquimarina sp. AD10]AXT60222.1 T9SS C-terminal target domain-containing protein [Aquimarina sp. AD10]RKN01342.1 T9SS C-terminal target domain-containing protein [Aquimarina sp. AD10]
MKDPEFTLKEWCWKKIPIAFILLLFVYGTSMLNAQVNTGGSATTANHNKQVIGYITNWDAWKQPTAGVPAQGALTQLNIDYSKYTILNYSFFGVANDGSLHSGDLRNKQIYQTGVTQEPADLLYGDPYSSWDFHILFGEIETVNYISPAVKERAEAMGYQVTVGGTSWTHPEWGLSGVLPLPLPKVGSGAKGLLELAHENGVKVMASIGGWSMCKHFPEMAADPVKKARFIEDCKKLINMGFDGIDLDWEYPGPFAGMNFTGTNADYANFENLVQEIRNAIGPGKLITAAMAADYKKLEGFNWSKLASSMDYFNMMTYDFNGGWSNIAGHNAPVYPYDGAEAPDFNWQTLLTKMTAMGVPASKINFGAPFYGRGVVTDGTAALNAPTVKRNVTIQPDGPVSTAADYTHWPQEVYDGTPNYFFIKQKTGAGSGWTKKWDDQAKVPYMVKGNFFLSYDDEESIAIKAQFINDNNLAGTIVWTVFGDLEFSGSPQSFGTKLKRWSNVKSPLINKINEVFAEGGNPPNNQNPSVTLTSPQSGEVFSAGSSVTISANATDTDGTVTKVEFYNGGTLLGQDTTAPYAYTWDNVVAGDYTISAKATDNKGGTATTSVSIKVNGIGGNESPSVVVTSPQEGDTFTAGASINIEANASDSDGTVTKVEFYNGTTKLGEDTTAPYSYSWNSVAAGSYTLTIKATDNKNAVGSASVAITITDGDGGSCTAPAYVAGQVYTGGDKVSYKGNEYEAKWWTQNNDPVTNNENVWKLIGPCGDGDGSAPQVVITSPTSGASFIAGNNITINANASDSDGTVTKVEFYNGTTKLGEDVSSPFSYTLSNVATGNYSLTAKATDNDNKSTTSTAVNVSVTTDGGDGCTSSSDFKVVGYAASWQGSANDIQYDKLTHINYSFILPNADGSLRALDNIAKLQQIVSKGHAQNTKVLIAVGGWMDGNDGPFKTLAANASTRTAFVNNLVSFVNQYNLDGVDMDWEYPREGSEPQHFELLMQELGQAMHSRGKLLTAAVVVSGWNADGVLNGVFDDVDFLNIMAYDGPTHGSMDQATGGLDYWLGRGLPKEKAILGVPFYSRPQVKSYSQLLASGASPNADSYQGTNYNGIPTIKKKTEIAKERAGGIMIWELSHDTNDQSTSLLTAIHQVVGDPCSGNDEVDGGVITGGPFTFTVGDGIADNVSGITLNGNKGTNSQWVITDEEGKILGLPGSPEAVNFDEAGAGVCLIWHLSYEDGLQGATVGNNASNLVGTYDLSNAIRVTRNTSTGGGDCDEAQYVESGGNYVAGSKVQNDGKVYQCRDYPNSGWCNGAAWAYAPGTGTYWQDAWTFVGDCTGGGGNSAPIVTITSPASGTSFDVGATVNITATASDSDGTIEKVVFSVDGIVISEDNSAPYTTNWTATQGNHTITATATDNLNATGDATPTTISVGSTPPPGGGNLPKRILVGYWHNFNNGSSIPKLSEISDKWDVVNISFAIPTVPGGANMTFTPDPAIYSSVQEFKNDVALLQSRGKKVLISMGGATGAVDVDSAEDARIFSNSMIGIINEYGFDGMDIDFEGSSIALSAGDTDFRNPVGPKVVNLITAFRSILSQFGSDFILSMAPETAFVQGGYSAYGGSFGAYLPVIYALRNDMDYIHVQHYNTGTMRALDDQIYAQGTADFHVAMAEMLLQGFPVNGIQFPALRADQVAIGLPSTAAAAPAGGYTAPAEVHKALDYLIKGQSFGGRYTLRNPSGYANFRGLMTWSINWDVVGGFGFSNPHRAYLDGLAGKSALVQKDQNSDVILTPNPVSGDVININVNCNVQKGTFDLQIFNATGIQVLDFRNTKIQKGENLSTFDVSRLEDGLYFYTINTPSGKTTGKLLKH